MSVKLNKISDLTTTTGVRIEKGEARMVAVIKFQTETSPGIIGEILKLQKPGLPLEITIDSPQQPLPWAEQGENASAGARATEDLDRHVQEAHGNLSAVENPEEARHLLESATEFNRAQAEKRGRGRPRKYPDELCAHCPREKVDCPNHARVHPVETCADYRGSTLVKSDNPVYTEVGSPGLVNVFGEDGALVRAVEFGTPSVEAVSICYTCKGCPEREEYYLKAPVFHCSGYKRVKTTAEGG